MQCAVLRAVPTTAVPVLLTAANSRAHGQRPMARSLFERTENVKSWPVASELNLSAGSAPIGEILNLMIR